MAKIIVIDSFIGRWGYSKTFVRSMLTEAGKDGFEAHISSLGGELDHALDIHDQFAEYKGSKLGKLNGFIASSATIIALPLYTRISKNAFYLIHKPLSWVDEWGYMNEDDLAKLIDDLTKNKNENEKMTLTIANLYHNRAKSKGKTFQDVLDLMKQDTWITGQEAFDWGFVDEVYEPSPTEAKYDLTAMASFINAAGLPEISKTRLPASSSHNNQKPDNTMKTLVLNRINTVLNIESIEIDGENGAYMQEEQLNTIESTIESLSGDIANKTSEIQALGEQIIESTTQIDTLTQTIAERDKTIVQNTIELETLRANADQVTPLTTQVNDLTETVTERDNRIAELETQVQNLSSRLTHTPAARALNFAAPAKENSTDGPDWDTINNLPHNIEVDNQ